MTDENWERTARIVEFSWWMRELNTLGVDAFREKRRSYFNDVIAGFGGRFRASGNVVNIGTGLMSIFDFIEVGGKKTCYEVDPLAEKYAAVAGIPAMVLLSTELIENESADVVICINMLDHTSEPERMVSEIHRMLRKDGVFYFEVNFDKYESPAHYQHFSKKLVHQMFGEKFKIKFEKIKADCGPLKNWDEYYAIMEKV